MNFDTWDALYRGPYETRAESAERYAKEQGYDDPAEKQRFLESLPKYQTPFEAEANFNYDTYKGWSPPAETPSSEYDPDYVENPSVWNSLSRGKDLADVALYGVGEGPVSGFLDDIGLEGASDSLKEWSREGRLRNEADAATVAPALTVDQEVAANPDSVYKYFDKDMMTLGQMAESAPTSLTPFVAALPLALAAPYAAAGLGIASLGTVGSTLIGAGTAMTAGNLASSALVSSEAYERGKSDPIIRQQLGVDPNKKFEDLLPEDQQKVDGVATDLSQTSFGHRLYTAGLVEMASYIPYGHAILRLGLDAGLGTLSEVWDRVLYSEDAVSALIEYGVPAEKAEELRNAIIEAGPTFRQTLISALQQEIAMGGAASTIETLTGKTDPKVNRQATASKVLNEEVKRANEIDRAQKQAQIENQGKAQQRIDEINLKARLKEEQDFNKQHVASLFKDQENNNNNKPEPSSFEEAALKKTQDSQLPMVLPEEGEVTYQDIQELEGEKDAYEESLVDQQAEPFRSEAKAKEEEARFKANLPISVEDLNRDLATIKKSREDYKKGSDLDRQAEEREIAIKAKIKELTQSAVEKDSPQARLKEKESIAKEERVLSNIEKKIFGVKGENQSRFGWSAEKFIEYNFYKERKLKLQHRKELANTELKTQEQIERRKAIQKEEIAKQAADIIDNKVKPSAISSNGEFTLSTQTIQGYIDDLGSRFKKYMGIYTVLSQHSPQNFAKVLLKQKNEDGSPVYVGKDKVEKALVDAKRLLKENNAFVLNDHVYVVAENMKGDTRKEALENLVKIVTFHEPIAHLGLKQFLGNDYNSFLDNFFNTNKEDIQSWAENEAVMDGEAVYLGGTPFDELSESQQRDLGEEFLANKFVELGILDPDIVSKTADSLMNVLKDVISPKNKRVSTVQARTVLAQIQRDYLGGKKNIITGDLFDPANWTMKGFEVDAGDDKVEAYRKYLEEQGIQLDRPTDIGTTPTTVSADVFQRAPLIDKDSKYNAKLEEERESLKKGTERLQKKLKEQVKEGKPLQGQDNPVIYAPLREETATVTLDERKKATDGSLKFSKRLKSAPKKTIKASSDIKRTPLQEKVYAILKAPTKGITYTKTFLRRKKHPSPKNKLQSFTFPNGYKVWVGKNKTTENWVEQVKSTLSKKEVLEAKEWYRSVSKVFEKEFGKENAPKMITAWGLANKAESPLGAMQNILRARENLVGGLLFPKQGGLNDAAITKVLQGVDPEKGSGVKLYDFVDSLIGSKTRLWTGHDSRMGEPVVVDRHTWRDGGYIDKAFKNAITKAMPGNKKAKLIKVDRDNPLVTNREYEQTALWIKGIVDDLNGMKFAGRKDWTGSEVQAVGWMSVVKVTGEVGETPQQVISETSRDVLFEVTPGTGAPLLDKYPQLNKLTMDQRKSLSSTLGDTISKIALKETGVLETAREKGLGWYLDTDMQPNIMSRISTSEDSMMDLINIIGYLAQQDSVIAYGPKSGARQIGLDFIETEGQFSDSALVDKFYRKLRGEFKDYFSGGTEAVVGGKGSFRALLFEPQAPTGLSVENKKLWTQKETRKIISEIKPAVEKVAKDLGLKGIDIKGFSLSVFSADNNWTENKNGEGYIQRILQRYRPNISRRILDNGPKEVERTIQKQFDKFGIKYSKRRDNGVSGTTSQGTYEGRLNVESDGQSHFVHWSKSPDLIETDPSYHGTGIAGRERQNKKLYPDIFVPRTYIGLSGYSKEGGLGENMYEIQLDPNTLYDGNKDPDGLFAQVVEEMGLEQDAALRSIKYENKIKEAGYVGYFNISAQIAALFNPTKVKLTRKTSGRSTYVPSIRGDQGIKASKRLTREESFEQYVSHQQEGIKPVGRPDTPEWNKFMEGSKIKYPLYHGTRSGMDYFDYYQLREGDYHTGLHLSSEPEYANMYADPDSYNITIGATDQKADLSERINKGEAPNVIKGFVNVKNPLKLEGKADVKNWEKGIRALKGIFQVFESYNQSDDTTYDSHLLNNDLSKKDRQLIIEELNEEKFFSKKERSDQVKYWGLNLLKLDDINRNFYKFVKSKLSLYFDGRALDVSMDIIINKGMKHDSLLYVQDIGDSAPRPFIGVMLLNPEFTQTGIRKNSLPQFETPDGLPSFPFRSAFNQKPTDINNLKFSKRLNGYSPDELISEWKTNVKAAVKGDQPEKKKLSKADKVTISKEAKAILNAKPTIADLSPKGILHPDGNIKASKVLASRASNFALKTTKEKDVPLRYKFAERLIRGITPQGSLQERLKYLATRRLVKGKIKKAEDLSRSMYNILKKTKQGEVIYKYLTTRDANPNKITNKVERKAAIEAKRLIDDIGEQLVKTGLLDKGAREEYKGRYLPREYLKYLLMDGSDSFLKVKSGGGAQVDVSYTKQRLDELKLPKEVRELILGEIKDPAYLVSKTLSVPSKDMAILDWLQQIAGNENWVARDTMVSFDTLKEIKKARLPLEMQKGLELKDTEGVKVSAHWLQNEAKRIWDMTRYMDLDKADGKIVADLVEKMEKTAKAGTKGTYDKKLYTKIPNTKKYGMLAGMAVRKEIAEDIFGGMDMTTGEMSNAEKLIGDQGKLGEFNRFWKWAKVSANPPSWVRNSVSNLILMNMGGVSFFSMPDLILSSVKDIRKSGKYKGELHQLSKDMGLTAGNMSNIELGRIEREFKDLQIRLERKKGTPMAAFGMLVSTYRKFHDVTSDTYGGIDTVGKMMMLENGLKKKGLKVKDLSAYSKAERLVLDDIAYNAEKWLFDYSNVLPSVKYLRNVPFGAPFASFTSFVAPLMLETAITKPWKFLPYYALGYAMKEAFKDEFELSDEEYEGFKVSMSDYLREKAYSSIFPAAVVPFPVLDKNKRIQFMDVSYLFPWGIFSEIAGEIQHGEVGGAIRTAGLLGSPGLNVASAIMTGIDPFTRQKIVDDTGTNSEKAADMLWYAFNLSAPPMLHGIFQGPGQGYGAVKRLKDSLSDTLSKDGEAKFTTGQAIGRMFGMNVTPIAVPEGRNKHLRYEYSKYKKLEYKAKREIKNMMMMQISKGEIQEVAESYKEKLIKARDELAHKVKISTPPMTLIREREKFLRKKRQSAEKYRQSL